MKELISTILSGKAGDWTRILTGKLGFGVEQATAFLPAALKQVFKVLQSGKLDFASLFAGGGISDIMSKMNLSKVAEKAGVSEEKAAEGVQELLPEMISAVRNQAGDADSLMKQLGGDAAGKLGDVGGLANKLFGK